MAAWQHEPESSCSGLAFIPPQGGCETLGQQRGAMQQRTRFQGVALAGSRELAGSCIGEGHTTRAGGSAELAIRRTDRTDSGTSAMPVLATLRAHWRAPRCRAGRDRVDKLIVVLLMA
jgi:hypothetical protein